MHAVRFYFSSILANKIFFLQNEVSLTKFNASYPTVLSEKVHVTGPVFMQNAIVSTILASTLTNVSNS